MTVTYKRFTLKQLAVAALKYLDVPSDDDSILSTGLSYEKYVDAKGWANLALQELADAKPWPWLRKCFQSLTIAAGASTADLPEDFHRFLARPSYDGGLYEFAPATIQDVHDLRTFSIQSATPYVCTMGWNATTGRYQLIVWPPADVAQTAKISYTPLIPEMTSDSGEPGCPPNFHKIVLLGTLAYAASLGERNWQGPEWQAFGAEVERTWERMAPTTGAVPLRKHHHVIRGTNRMASDDLSVNATHA